MIILFIRHAEAKNDKLTRFGRKQTKLLALQQEDYEFAEIYCSPLERCKLTAKAYNKKLNLKITADSRLRERETLYNSPKNEQEQLWYDNYMNGEFSFKNPEGCKELLERVASFLDEKIKFHKLKNENFVIVSHSGIFYAVMAYLNKNHKNIDWYKLGTASKVYFEINEK